ncbi:putative methyltransferase B0361.6 [Diplonema papillatum]|nr:putative methyltransferase B0361.6 [Diplonema papillatum]
MPVRENTWPVNTRKKGLSVALPSSILDVQHKPILQTYVVGQISRALAVYRVEEIIIFNEHDSWEPPADELFAEHARFSSSTAFVARNLMLTECPQYLKKPLFPLHIDTRDCGALPPLMLESHPLATDDVDYREGMAIAPEDKPEADLSSVIECGIDQPIKLSVEIPVGMRVTVKLDREPEQADGKKRKRAPITYTGTPITRQDLLDTGAYWGYTVRTAQSLSDAMGPPGEYDYIIGTSERGVPVRDPAFRESLPDDIKRPLLVVGGPGGLEKCIAGDRYLRRLAPEKIFNAWVNVLPNQGSKTIRSEEALFMCLASMQDLISW